MIVKIDRSFEKDTNRLNDSKVLNKIADCIENTQKVKNIIDIPGLKN